MWPVIGASRETSDTTWSEQQRSLTQRYLEECTARHPRCPYHIPPLPTRVLDVGSHETEPYLYISKGERARYATLSHCWGGRSPITTTTETIEQYQREVKFDGLPKTFKDAVIISRSLGIQYLWIDSLCILQNSTEDWEREAAGMNTVYANCYIMIAADDSENCRGGCFMPKTIDNQTSFSIESPGPWRRPSRAYFRLTNIRDQSQNEVCHRLYDPQSGFIQNALNKRGWTLQERILAPRILHCGRSEMAWECAEKIACECQILSTEVDKESRFKARFRNPLHQLPSPPKDTVAGLTKNSWIWSNIVEEFTRRKLTRYADTLYAISGLANRMSPTATSEYVCGMWRKNLLGFLRWKPDYGYIRANQLVLDSKDLLRRHHLPIRHKDYYAPSWSWASIIGPIKYEDCSSILSPHGKMQFKVSKGETDWAGDEKYLCTILDIHCDQATLHPFAPPSSASLTIRGYVAPVTFQAKTKTHPGRSSENGGLLVATSGGSPAGSTLISANFEPDVSDEHAEVSGGDSLFLLFVAESETSEEGMRMLPTGDYEGLWRKCFGSGIVLKPVYDAHGASGTYKRVGTFYYEGEALWEGWRNIRITQTICLI